jgi:osmotically-inducible protein OsmY
VRCDRCGRACIGTGWDCIPVIRTKAISVNNIGVINGIAVKSRVQAADVKAKILAALKRDAEFEADGIHVNVLGDKVILDGKIKAWHERSVAERAAWSAAGVCSVEDNLHVG